ncbi:unnamed protein product [Staurois parvus]|uniref:Uncharacterized protein n=1 Tax=Staurois parvus TaxID=386267 RepID=A0ABN9BIQ7_9NEOB|nr:unnamed protein product [Staurois parvus]
MMTLYCTGDSPQCSAASQCHQSVPSSCASQCLSVPSSDASQCHLSVLSISTIISAAYQCHLISAAYQCPSVLPISAHQCCLLVLISAASSTHISEGEKLPV